MNRLDSLLGDPRSNDYYLIGEIAYNHEGNLDFALETVEQLCKHPVQAVKIHVLLDIEEYMTPENPDWQLRYDWLWTEAEYGRVIDRIRELGKEVIVMPDDTRSAAFCSEHGGVDAIELHAVCLNDRPLLEAFAAFEGPVMLGIGGSTVEEIADAVEFLRMKGKDDIILMYGIQTYPTDLSKINLKKMNRFAELFGCEVGYADHTAWDHPDNAFASCFGYLQGHRILEKHYTHAYGEDRIDFQAATGDAQMKELVHKLDLVKLSLGSGSLELNDSELKYGAVGPMKKAIIATRDIAAGEVLTAADVTLKRSGGQTYMKQTFLPMVIGRKTAAALKKHEKIEFEKLEGEA